MGVYGHVISLLKQILFQGQEIQLRNVRWVASVGFLAIIAQGTWLLDALIRQRYKISEMYSFLSLISAPVSALVLVCILVYSERNLGDKINWIGATVWVVGMALSMIGAQWMLNK